MTFKNILIIVLMLLIIGGVIFWWTNRPVTQQISEGEISYEKYTIQPLRKELAQRYNFFYVGDFSAEGIARVQKDNRWYYIDATGKEITAERFDMAYPFKEGIGLVVKGGQYSETTTKEGAVTIYQESRAKHYFIDTTGEEITDKGFDIAGDFSNGVANVYEGDRWYFIDKTGKNIFIGSFNYANPFYEGVASVSVEKDNEWRLYDWYLIDKTGFPITDEIFDYVGPFSDEGLAPVLKDGKYYFIDKSGKRAIDEKFALAFPFSDGVAKVYYKKVKKGQSYFIDKTGKKVMSGPEFEDISFSYFREGLAVVFQNGKYYFIDKNGGKAFDEEFDFATIFFEGTALVKKGTDSYHIDHQGNRVFSYK